MLSRGLRLARPISNALQKRGMASVKNWKRPSMDEYLGPKDPWQQVMDKRSKEGNLYLLGGLLSLGSAVAMAISLDFIDLHPDPLKWEGVKK